MPPFYIVLDKEIPGVDAYVNGSLLSKNNDELERIAKRLKVRSLMSFFSISPEEASSFAEGHGVELKSVPEENWFAADEGLTTVNALLARQPWRISCPGALGLLSPTSSISIPATIFGSA